MENNVRCSSGIIRRRNNFYNIFNRFVVFIYMTMNIIIFIVLQIIFIILIIGSICIIISKFVGIFFLYAELINYINNNIANNVNNIIS